MANEDSVFNFSTVKWLERHNKQKMVTVEHQDEGLLRELESMFDYLDIDGSGTIDIYELREAISKLEKDSPQYREILNQMSNVDEDNNGEIDFDEFVSAIVSDGMQRYALDNEQDRKKFHFTFFQFANDYRRKQIIEKINDKDGSTSDASRFSWFKELFSRSVLPEAPDTDEVSLPSLNQLQDKVASHHETKFRKRPTKVSRQSIKQNEIRQSRAASLKPENKGIRWSVVEEQKRHTAIDAKGLKQFKGGGFLSQRSLLSSTTLNRKTKIPFQPNEIKTNVSSNQQSTIVHQHSIEPRKPMSVSLHTNWTHPKFKSNIVPCRPVARKSAFVTWKGRSARESTRIKRMAIKDASKLLGTKYTPI